MSVEDEKTAIAKMIVHMLYTSEIALSDEELFTSAQTMRPSTYYPLVRGEIRNLVADGMVETVGGKDMSVARCLYQLTDLARRRIPMLGFTYRFPETPKPKRLKVGDTPQELLE